MSEVETQSASAVLAGVRENFLSIASRGWFLPKSDDCITNVFPRSERGGALGYRKAAVLALISYHNSKLQVLLTKRSLNISFKGEEI